MAEYQRHRSATYGALAYDLDALARERQLDDAGKLPQKKARPQAEVQPVQRRRTAAEAAGMSTPSSGQIQYIDLSGADSVEVYAAGGGAALHQLTGKVAELWSYVLEYFR